MNSAISNNLAWLRIERGWSMQELAKRASIGKSRYCQIEGGNVEPTLWELVRLAAALETSLNALVQGV